MNKFYFIKILLVFSTTLIFAQDKNIHSLELEFQSFNYQNVISFSEELLQEKSALNNDEIQQIYLLKGISHFSLSDERRARESFIELLKLDEEYEPDPVQVSPKIIRFFDDVKNEYEQIVAEDSNKQITKTDTIFVKEPVYVESNLKEVLVRSVVLPGWGHLYSGNKFKGVLLTTASVGLIGASVYYAIDARNKEKEYLSETQSKLIQQKYEDYNNSYKLRNIFLFSYLAVWLYSQSDILFFNTPDNLQLDLSSSDGESYNLNFKYFLD